MKTINNVIKAINKAHSERVTAACYCFAWSLDMNPEKLDSSDLEIVQEYVEAYLNHSEGITNITPIHIEAVLEGLDTDLFSTSGEHINQMVARVKAMLAEHSEYLARNLEEAA